jgi:hypothetical protein
MFLLVRVGLQDTNHLKLLYLRRNSSNHKGQMYFSISFNSPQTKRDIEMMSI